MDVEWNKTTQENVKVNGAVSSSVCFPTGSGCVQAGQVCTVKDCPKAGQSGTAASSTPCNVTHPITSTEQVLTVMSIYQNEWAHYDDIVWKHAFTHFGFILAVILFPFVTPWVRKSGLAELPYFPCVFPGLGIALAAVLLLVMLRYAVRMRCCGSKYRDLIEKLPEPYQEKRINKDGRFSITITVAIIMFILLVAVAVFAMFLIPQWRDIVTKA